jgi:di/tricarboxylate transporter
MLLGALLVFVTRCISPDDAYRQVEWKVLILIGCMLSLGTAMQSTGTAEYLAERLTSLVGTLNPLWLLTGFFALTVFLTQPMSNQAAAAVVIPVALQTAVQLGLNPRTFAMMIAIAASTSYLTPLEPACLMVYGPGRYRFMDFVRVGGLLTVVIYLIAIVMTPLLWPLR